ncbi:bridging integrator 3-like [Corticium candelabrum]|uniref:bridging integrator 3-like n=1 Tax=Corticium candelabrum TaxID=121492 RepID=UPI002E3693C4|nr:bridging integrator 3-like [Corticium candelabrum]
MAGLMKKLIGGRRANTRTGDTEFDRSVTKFRQVEGLSKRVYKDTKRCTEAISSACKAAQKLGNDLANSSVVEQTDLKETAEDFRDTMTEMSKLAAQLHSHEQKTVIEPMKKFSQVCPSVDRAVRKRDQKMAECEKLQAKVDKLKEKSPQQTSKLESTQRELARCKPEFERINSQLTQEIPFLYERRIDYFEPCFEALIKSEMQYYQQCYCLLNDLEEKMHSDDEDMSDDAVEKRIQQQLGAIKALSIVASN